MASTNSGVNIGVVKSGEKLHSFAQIQVVEKRVLLKLDPDHPLHALRVLRNVQGQLIYASPLSRSRKPSRISTVVVLPAPLGPNIPNISPLMDLERDAINRD